MKRITRDDTEHGQDYYAAQEVDLELIDLRAENERLRAALQEADNIMGHQDEHTEWRERWQALWPWGDGPSVAIKPLVLRSA